MKSIWNGTISFGLVTIPVHLYSAIKAHSIGFRLLCKACKSPVVYERWCKHCDKEVSWNEIVKGLELPDGSYFIITHENLRALKPSKTDSMVVHEFIHKDQLELIYTDQHYYLTPSAKGERAYLLLYKVLEQIKGVAIATFVMREKEHLCAITPYHSILLVTTLNYSYEVQPIPVKQTPALEHKSAGKAEFELAQELVHKYLSKKFDLSKYKDTFAQRLITAIKESKKRPGKRKNITKREETALITKDTSLLQTLRASLGNTKKREKVKK